MTVKYTKKKRATHAINKDGTEHAQQGAFYKKQRCTQCELLVSQRHMLEFQDVKLPLYIRGNKRGKPRMLLFCSQECFDKYKEVCLEYLKQKEIPKDDVQFYNYIIDLYETPVLPPSFYCYTQDVIKGIIRVQYRIISRSNDNCVSWLDLLNTYKFCESEIKKARATKTFDNLSQELNYGLAIVKSNISKVMRLTKQQKLDEELEEVSGEEDFLTSTFYLD